MPTPPPPPPAAAAAPPSPARLATSPNRDSPAPSPMTLIISDELAVDCIFCLSSLPLDSPPELTPEHEPVAQLVPCSHFMHDRCLKPWSEIANTCPICRLNFNQVNVLRHMSGPILGSYQVEDKVQRVAGDGLPPAVEEGDDGHNYLGPIFDAPYDPMPARLQRAWDLAWERLDADLDRPQEDYYVQQDPREHRISRRRAVAAAQTGLGPNAFDGAGWTIPSARPRMTFPHLQPEISKEESDSWKMMELAEKIEAKRRRSSLGSDDMLAPMGVDMKSDSDGRKFKRPRTKRDSQLAPINTQFTTTITTSSSNNIVTEAEASSPPSGGLFTSILEGIGRFQEVPIVSAADVSGRDLGRMWPISPDCSSTTSAMSTFSRSRSPPAMYPPGSTPTSPPTSRPTSPAGERGRRLYPNSPTRTPIGSPERGGRRKPWDAAPSPPASRMQSPSDMRPSRRQHSRSGESSASDSDTRRGRATRENKAEIVKMVSAALKPLYPARIDKEAYTEINKRISRQMYKFVGEVGVTDREAWREAIDKEVKREVERSAGGDM